MRTCDCNNFKSHAPNGKRVVSLFLVSTFLILSISVKTVFNRFDQRARWFSHQCWISTGYEPPRRITFPIVYAAWDEASDRYAEDLAYATVLHESGCDPVAVGYRWKFEHPKYTIHGPEVSWGSTQPLSVVAEICEGRPVTSTELLMDHALTVRIGIKHLRNTKTYQAYSAGTTGAKRGKGGIPAYDVFQKLQKLPWVKRTRGGKLDGAYSKFFNFTRCNDGWGKTRRK